MNPSPASENFNFNNAPENYQDEDLIRAYLLAWTGQGDASHSWASDELLDLVEDDPERAWRIILPLCEQAPNIEFESILAAGAIENLLSKHGHEFIERVEQRAASDAKFNHVLGGVWRLDMPEAVWRRLEAARKEVW